MTLDTRWRKLFRDIGNYPGRALTLLVAVSIAVFSVTTMLGAYGIVKREVPVNYLKTNPAHTTLELDAVTPAVLAAAQGFPGVEAAEPRAVVEARAKVGDEWMRMLLFVVADFDAMRLNTFSRDSGTWPPPTGSLLLERQALGFLDKREGQSLTIRLPRGSERSLPVSGIVHDTTLAPAWQEQTGYGYITPDTLAAFGASPVLDELRVRFDGNPRDAAIVDAKAIALADALRAQGATVHAIKVPPPGEHPHETLMQASLRNFAMLSGLALVLAAILVAAVLAGILARQVREIGVMKAVGARSSQVARMYGVLLLALGTVSVAIGVPPGVIAAGQRAQAMADTLNFTVTDEAVPAWVYVVVAAAGLLLPLLMSLPAILKASRSTVREALSAVGVPAYLGAGGIDRMAMRLGGFALPWALAVRNAFRRRGRLMLSLAMLSAGGGLFMTALNVSASWLAVAERVKSDRLYDGAFRLVDPVAANRIGAVLSHVGGIEKYEVWQASQAAVAQDSGNTVMRTYPDRGHGSFTLFGVPPRTDMVRFPLTAGRWLADGDVDAIVVTQRHFAGATEAKVGERIQLVVDGKVTSWRVVGTVQEVGGGGAYVTRAGYAQAAGSDGVGNEIRIIAAGPTSELRTETVRAAEAALDHAGVRIERSMPLDRQYDALVGHMEVPSRMLIGASLILVLLGAIGVASMMAMNVLERTREIGVMKAVGATPATVVKIVAAEALFIGAMSWFAALLLSLVITVAIAVIGRHSGLPIPFIVSSPGAAIWLGLVLIIALIASTGPAVRAARLIVREALAYE
jgi:putative ABC transport system permease protein